MSLRRALSVGRTHGVAELARLGADKLKQRSSEHLDLDFWTTYHTTKNIWRFDLRSVADPLAIRLVDPWEVRARLKFGSFDRVTNIGSVRGGDWDRHTRSIGRHPTIRGLHQRFEEGYDWEDTDYFSHNVRQIQAGREMKGCSTVEAFRQRRCAFIDSLYERIAREGYRSQAELGPEAVDLNRHDPTEDRLRTNEVGLNIGRHGEWFINSGFHRLAIARILGLETIPVQVIVRHTGWQRRRESFLDTVSSRPESNGSAIDGSHPDLFDLHPITGPPSTVEEEPMVSGGTGGVSGQ